MMSHKSLPYHSNSYGYSLTLLKPDHLKSNLQKLRILNVWISDPHSDVRFGVMLVNM